MGLSLKAFTIATMMQSANANYGRFEVRHREVGESKEVGKLLAMEPLLDTELFFEVGPSITDTSNLGLEVYGTTGLVNDATLACADGKQITGDVLSTKAFTLEQASGTAGFTLDLTKLEETLLAYSGDKVDICARIKYDNTIQTFVDTRIVIDRTYTADLGETVTIGDPSSGKFNKADDTTVSVTEFFCDAEKTDIGTNLEFRAGQDIRICVNPVQDQDSLFEYKVETFNDVKCTFVGTETAFDVVFDDVFNVIETDTESGTGSFFFVLQSTFVALSDVRQLQCTGKVVLSSTRKPQTQRLLSSRSSSDYDNSLVRTLQETLEDVETTFSIDLTIIDEDSGASCASSTAAALAVGSLAAVLL